MTRTGSTDAQIAAAVTKETTEYLKHHPDWRQEVVRNAFDSIVSGYAESLVDEHHRIVSVADLERLIDGFNTIDDAFFERIRALIGAGDGE